MTFAEFLINNAGAFFGFLGAGGEDYYPLHNSRMTINENVLPYGAAVLANSAVEWLKNHN